jgi:hypothetical protein
MIGAAGAGLLQNKRTDDTLRAAMGNEQSRNKKRAIVSSKKDNNDSI